MLATLIVILAGIVRSQTPSGGYTSPASGGSGTPTSGGVATACGGTANTVLKLDGTGANCVASSIVDNAGVAVGSATGGPQGAGTINATNYFINGVALATGPQNAPAVSNEFMTAYNSTTGAFTQSLIGVNSVSPNAYAVATGLVNVLAVTLSPAATALTAGLEVNFLPNLANTTTTPTLNVNGLGAVVIKRYGAQALVANDLITTMPAKVIYDGTQWELENPQTGNVPFSLVSAANITASAGNITGKAFLTGTNCAAVGTGANPSAVACTAAAAGAFSCATAASAGTCVVSTTAVTANSEVFVQQTTSESTRLSVTCNATILALTAPLVSAKSAGTSFTVTLPAFTVNPVCFDYHIVN